MTSPLQPLRECAFHLGVQSAKIKALLDATRIRPDDLVPVLSFGSDVVLPELRLEQSLLVDACSTNADAEGTDVARRLVIRQQDLMNALVALRHFFETKQDFRAALAGYGELLALHSQALPADCDWLETRLDDEGRAKLAAVARAQK